MLNCSITIHDLCPLSIYIKCTLANGTLELVANYCWGTNFCLHKTVSYLKYCILSTLDYLDSPGSLVSPPGAPRGMPPCVTFPTQFFVPCVCVRACVYLRESIPLARPTFDAPVCTCVWPIDCASCKFLPAFLAGTRAILPCVAVAVLFAVTYGWWHHGHLLPVLLHSLYQ